MQSTGKLSLTKLKDALETFDWAKVRSILDAAGGPTADADAVAEAVRRAGGLVLEYPIAAAEKRDALLKELEQYLAAGQADGQVPVAVALALSTLQVAEAGYRKLVDELSKTEASKLEPAVHVSAAIRRAEGELDYMTEQFHKQAALRPAGITFQTQLVDDSGNRVDMDSALENFVGFVSMTLQMEAFRHKWFDHNGSVVVPSLPEVTDEAVYQAGSTFALAVLWRRWRMTEQRARLLGRTLRFLSTDERPKDAPPELTTFIVEEGSDTSDWLHRVALERVTDRMCQNILEIGASVNLNRPRFKLPGDAHALPPHDWISNEEVLGLWGLEQYLAYPVVGDQERPGGLRLVEWVRGYCALMLLARDAKASEIIRTRSGWQDYLARYGLAAAESDVLIARLTFGRSSRDLFDHPFIKLADGRYRLFSIALRSLSVPIVVLSTLSHLGVQLKRKGKSFEVVVRETFENAGIKSYSFKARRGSEEYEYDVVVPWGGYLFVIECKNQSLPFGSPSQMRYFDLQTQDNIRQVHRLMQGLYAHPDILEENLPVGAATKVRVPVIVNCFPYSEPVRVDGIYLCDYSALSRFFESGEIKVKASSPGKPTVELGTGLRLWAGEAPTPEDLLKQLKAPPQFTTVAKSLERDQRGFPLLPDWWVHAVNFVRRESEDLAEARALISP